MTNSFSRYYIQVRKIWDKPTVRQFSQMTATLFLIAFFLLFALKPTIETIFELNKKIDDAKITESEMTSKITNLNAAINIFQKISPDLPLLDQYYPSSPQAKQIIDIVNIDAEKTGMQTKNYSIGEYKESDIKGQIAIRFSSSNNYISTMAFVDNLINSKRLIVLDSLNISESKEKGQLEISINGNTFYEK